jgi:hypothetical protein
MISKRCAPRWAFSVPFAAMLLLSTSGSALAQPAVDGVVDALYGAAIATDKAGDGQATPILDLRELYLYAGATHLYVAIKVQGDVVATNWAKYMLYVDTTNDSAGATTDAWGRKVTVADPHKPELSINAWVDQPPFSPATVQIWSHGSAGWVQPAGVGITAAALKGSAQGSVIEYSVPLSVFGGATTIWVEAWTTGGGGSNAQDTLNVPAEDWNATDWSSTATLSVSTPFSLVAPTPDAGVPDSGTPDAGVPDVGVPDVGVPDVGVPDAGVPDVGVPDSGTPDTGTPDTGTPDTGTPDTGMTSPDTSLTPDSAAVDTGTPADGSAPDQGGTTLDQGGATPDQGGATPDQGGATPDQATTVDSGNAGLDGGGGPPSASEGCHLASGSSPLPLPLLLLGLLLLTRRRY